MPSVTHLDITPYDVDLVDLILEAPLPELVAGKVDRITSIAVDWLLSTKRLELPVGCQAGLWLLCGDLERSHAISQSIKSPEGSYWHGIMHRQEGDFSNAKYWMHSLTKHSVTQQLARLDDRYVDPIAFIDACQRGSRSSADQQLPLRQTQWLEWQLLFEHCYIAHS